LFPSTVFLQYRLSCEMPSQKAHDVFCIQRTSSMANVKGASLKRQAAAIGQAASANKHKVLATLQCKGVSGTMALEAAVHVRHFERNMHSLGGHIVLANRKQKDPALDRGWVSECLIASEGPAWDEGVLGQSCQKQVEDPLRGR
jgi:hypothetical protein